MTVFKKMWSYTTMGMGLGRFAVIYLELVFSALIAEPKRCDLLHYIMPWQIPLDLVEDRSEIFRISEIARFLRVRDLNFVTPSFGTPKEALGYDHFLLKGLEKVRAEWSLITLVYNLKRVLNLVSFEKLMAAVS